MGVSEEDVKRMQARVAGAAARGAEPVRANLPVTFTLIGHAVSINDYHIPTIINGKPAKVKSKEARDWDALMISQLREQWGLMLPYAEELFVIADVYIAANTMDDDNPLKPLQDALQNSGVIKNDRLVRRSTITKFVDRNRPRIEVHLYPSTLKPL